jgi:1-acyl-sn-glycerol-3-phosphate acyltransferase
MPHIADRLWRTIATGIAFSLFGLGGCMLGLIAFPLLQLTIRHPGARTRTARIVVRQSFRLFITLMRCLGLLHYRIINQHKLERSGLLILANHPTLIDVVFLISMVPDACCIVRNGLARNPVTRGPIAAAGYIANDCGPGLIEQCGDTLSAGSNLIIFPEGTRTPLSGRLTLQRGAANIAVRNARNITPVIIHCAPRGLTKGTPWWHIPERPLEFVITVREDIPVAPFLAEFDGEPALAARRLTQYMHDYFSTENQPHARA